VNNTDVIPPDEEHAGDAIAGEARELDYELEYLRAVWRHPAGRRLPAEGRRRRVA
jgi:hypothetical protein